MGIPPLTVQHTRNEEEKGLTGSMDSPLGVGTVFALTLKETLIKIRQRFPYVLRRTFASEEPIEPSCTCFVMKQTETPST